MTEDISVFSPTPSSSLSSLTSLSPPSTPTSSSASHEDSSTPIGGTTKTTRGTKKKRAPYSSAACIRCIQMKVKCVLEDDSSSQGQGRGCKRCINAKVYCQGGNKKTSQDIVESRVVSPTSLTARLGTSARSASLCFHLYSIHQRVRKEAELPMDGNEFHRWATFDEGFFPALERASGKVKDLEELDQIHAAIALLNGAKSSTHSEIIGSRYSSKIATLEPTSLEMAEIGAFREEALRFFQADLIKKVDAFIEHDDLSLAHHQFELSLRTADLLETNLHAGWARKAARAATLKGMALLKLGGLDEEKTAGLSYFVAGGLIAETMLSAAFGKPPQSTRQEILKVYDPDEPLPRLILPSEVDLDVVFPSPSQYTSVVTPPLRAQYTALIGPAAPYYLRACYESFYSGKTISDALHSAWEVADALPAHVKRHYYHLVTDPRYDNPPNLATQSIFAGLLQGQSLACMSYIVAHQIIQRAEFATESEGKALLEESRRRLTQAVRGFVPMISSIFKFITRPLGRPAIDSLSDMGQLLTVFVTCDSNSMAELLRESNRPLIEGLRVGAFFNPDVSRLVLQLQAVIDTAEAKAALKRENRLRHQDAETLVTATLTEL